jgi:GNAT superfamily N-acetyltransferase
MRPRNSLATGQSNDSLSFRAAVPADAPALSRIAIAAKRHWGYPDEWIGLWHRELTISPEEIQRNYFCVAQLGGQSAGFVSVSSAGSDAEMEHLWVLPEFIGAGIGRRLLKQALDWCSSHGMASLKVVADPNALGFYLAEGGKSIGRQASVPAPRELPVVQFSIPSSLALERTAR